MANVPKPVTRQDRYYDYLINGGDINKLPQPIDRIDKYLYYLCVNGFGGGGTVTPEQIQAAVDAYLEEHPVEPGATEEQAAQIEANKEAIAQLQENSESYLTEIPVATTESLGGVIPDGVTAAVDENGVLSVVGGGGSGEPGKSAYEIAVDNGFDGTEEEWLASLKGDPGEKGDKGDTGDSFAISKIYADSEEMVSDEEPVLDGLLVAIVNADNALVYIRDSGLLVPGEDDYVGYKYMTNLANASVIKGPKGDSGADAKINGVNTLTIKAGDNVEIKQKESVLTISATGGGSPIGEIIAYMGKTAPKNYLICNGATYNIADYPELSQHFIDNFGSANYFGGNGTTTFKVPDLRGEFLRGTGTNSHADQGNGVAVGKHQDATTIPTLSQGAEDPYLRTYKPQNAALKPENRDSETSGTTSAYKFAGSPYTANSTYRSYTARPTNTAVLYCIKCR